MLFSHQKQRLLVILYEQPINTELIDLYIIDEIIILIIFNKKILLIDCLKRSCTRLVEE
jgi:hypothetical protein